MVNDQNQSQIGDELEDDQVTLESQSNESSAGSQEEAAGDGVNDLIAKIESLEAELTQANEKAMRAAAEAQNVRRRAEQDVEKAHKYGVEKFAKDLLPVVDNLERAVQSATSEGVEMSAVVEGIELTLKSFNDSLKRNQVEAIDPLGEPFNPELHQAMSMLEQADAEPNSVVNVFQRGYTLSGRLIRPAMVVVAKELTAK